MGYAENGDWFSSFSGEQIDGRLYHAQGRNWIRNGYFAGGGTAGEFPINQRGSLSYSNAGGTIDGWELLQNQSLTINNEDIKIVAALDGGLSQTITNGQYLRSKTVTFSFVKNSAPASASVFADGNLLCELSDNTNRLSLKSEKFVIPSFATAISVRLNYGRFNAVCLEQGAVSTLATEVNGVLETMPYAPDYGEELAKCQMHYVQMLDCGYLPGWIDATGTYVYITAPLTVPLAALSSIGAIDGHEGSLATVGGGRSVASPIPIGVDGMSAKFRMNLSPQDSALANTPCMLVNCQFSFSA